MQKSNYKTNGFTLVELAIVLVIIGLLVGGVLQGQELIKQAQIRNHIKAVNELKLAVATFQTKYDALPGDIKKPERFFPACDNSVEGGVDTFRGDGNGRIEQYSSGGGGYETYCVWFHLYHSGIYRVAEGPKENKVDEGSSWPPADVNFATHAFFYMVWPTDKSLVAELGYQDQNHASARFLKKTNRHELAVWGENSGLRPDIVHSIDSKLDDGKPATGIVRALVALALDDLSMQGICYNPITMVGMDIATAHPALDAAYDVAEEAKSCWVSFAL